MAVGGGNVRVRGLQGALAWSAWDRAVDDDPEYSLARLLESAMRGGLTPHELRSAFTAFLDVVPA